MSQLNVLNVGAGDIEVRFNHLDDAEAKRAITMLLEMRNRGYAILVRDAEGHYQRAVDIDAKTGCYVLMLPEGAAVPDDAVAVTPAKRGRKKITVPVTKRSATGVARSAGG
jgi:hypothetical protein